MLATFSVQNHNLPFQLLTVEAALSIRETIGKVSWPKDIGEMKGGNFMRVRVEIDITKSLCRGRKISWDQSGNGWAAFIYERLPNICYWCGLVSHDDKDCDLWLNSQGLLRIEDQQFGSWIRAPQFNHVKKTVVEVQGYDQQRRMKLQHRTSTEVHTEKLTKERPGWMQVFDSVIVVPMEVNGKGRELVDDRQRHELEGRE